MGFDIQSYTPHTHEMKNRVLSKNKGCMFFLIPKIHQLPEYYMMFARKYFFSRIWGGGGKCPLPSVSYAYVTECIWGKCTHQKKNYHRFRINPRVVVEAPSLAALPLITRRVGGEGYRLPRCTAE